MPRTGAALSIAFACLLAGQTVRAEQILNVELSGGAGLSAYNTGTSSLLAPPYVQLQAAYLLVSAGPVIMGPALGLPVGFFEPDEGPWQGQVGLRPAWMVYGRPSVDLAWSVLAGPSFVLTDPFAWGLDVSGELTYFLTAGLGLLVGLDYAFYYGVDPVHLVSARLGVMISYEVLP